MKRWAALLMALFVVGAVSPATAGNYSNTLLQSRNQGTTTFRASATNATTLKRSDSTNAIPTNNWAMATITSYFSDSSAAGDSVDFTIRLAWSPDGTSWLLEDSIPHKTAENTYYCDSIVIRRGYEFLKVIIQGNPGNESGAGATTYSRGTLRLTVRRED